MASVTTNIAIGSNKAPATFAELITKFKMALQVNKQRKGLKTLTEAQLHDMGITKEEAFKEAARKFWDLPQGDWNAPSYFR